MTDVTNFSFTEVDLDVIATSEGRVAILVADDRKLSRAARRVNKLTRGAVQRVLDSEKFESAKDADVVTISWPNGMAAEAVDIVKLSKRPSVEDARSAGAALSKLGGGNKSALLLILAGLDKHAEDVILGVALRGYAFTDHKTAEETPKKDVTIMCTDVDAMQAVANPALAVADGVFMTRDLVNEPANVLTTEDFAARIEGLQNHGVEVEILTKMILQSLAWERFCRSAKAARARRKWRS